ncbi:hypothetical protein CASFOL_010986 [Castilleja foliolosa]|uniref:DUF1985 domain-containing protein n=1 Tax=Castilleja foliolosa TaxID=1961234 RepID=A0ABD3DYB0_9LAMI
MAMLPGGDYKLKLSQRANLHQVIVLLRKHLEEPYFAKFKGSCFGNFVKFSDVKFQGQLIGHLLLCQDAVPSADELVFNVHGKKARLGCVDFALVTGLSFGSYPVRLTRSDFHDRVFGKDHGSIKVGDISDKLKTFSEMEGEGETCLKLGMLLVVYGVLLAQSHSKKLDEHYIHLADTFEALNDYPWGRVAFEFLKTRTHDTMKDRVSTFKEKKCEKFDVHGFFHALQVWAYEVIPTVAEVCAVKTSPKETPRLARWKTVDKVVLADDLKKKCFPPIGPGDEGMAILELKPRKAERKSSYYKSVCKWTDDVRKIVDVPSDADQRKEVKKRKRKVADEDLNETENFGPVEKKFMLTRLRELEELVHCQQGQISWLLTKCGYKGEVNEEELNVNKFDLHQDRSADHTKNDFADHFDNRSADHSASRSADLFGNLVGDLNAADFIEGQSADPPSASAVHPSPVDHSADSSASQAVDTPANPPVDNSAFLPDDPADHSAVLPADYTDAPSAVVPADHSVVLSADSTVDPSAVDTTVHSAGMTADPLANPKIADPPVDLTADPETTDPSTILDTADPSVDPSADSTIADEASNPETVHPSTNPETADVTADHITNHSADPITNPETADLTADPSTNHSADPITNPETADLTADLSADIPSNPETVNHSADPENVDLAGNESADLQADPSSAMVVFKAVCVEPITVHNADSSAVTPDATIKKKKKKKGKEGDIVYETRKSNRTKKKGPATLTLYTDPDRQKKKKAKTAV